MIDHPPPCMRFETLPVDWNGEWFQGHNFILCREWFPVRLYMHQRLEHPRVPKYLDWALAKRITGKSDEWLDREAGCGLSPEQLYYHATGQKADTKTACDYLRGLTMGDFKFHETDKVWYYGNTYIVEKREKRDKDPEPRYYIIPTATRQSKDERLADNVRVRWADEQDLRKVTTCL